VIVLEDVDLVAEERSHGPASSPVLFDLLDAMDGAAPDADLLFLLTTNRADLLEPALAARPGRVDVAVEVSLPDAPARQQLLALYGRGVPLALTGEDIQRAVERTDGTTASFLKELIRRSVLEGAARRPGPAGRPAHGDQRPRVPRPRRPARQQPEGQPHPARSRGRPGHPARGRPGRRTAPARLRPPWLPRLPGPGARLTRVRTRLASSRCDTTPAR
jgi:SpoVK/Ycf46/Vps4 family AAA+-type ATPase